MSDSEPSTAAVRRAPYSANPTVGARGLRTQQRILDAALTVLGASGYERTTIERISKLAGCSRVSFYQYFSDKEDLFRHLAGQVARQLRASAEALAPLTPDLAGRDALEAWVRRYTDIYARYEPVFRAFSTAAESDAALAGGSVRTGERNIALFESKLSTTALPPRQLDPVVGLLLAAVTRTLDLASILRIAAPDAFGRERIERATADVIHRSLFGLQPGVNANPAPEAVDPPRLRFGAPLQAIFTRAAEVEQEAGEPGRRALAALLEVGHDVIVRCGYQGTRVDDLVEAAGISHGAFYRYFENKDELIRVVAAQALASVSNALADLPRPGADGAAVDRAAVRRWLKQYGTAYADKGAMIRVWIEGGPPDDPIRADRAATFDWGRRQMARLLRGRAYGDADGEAVVFLALIEAWGALPRTSAEVDAVMHVIERGFLAAP